MTALRPGRCCRRIPSPRYFPGQLLVISGIPVPQLLTGSFGKKEYRDVYMDLNGAHRRTPKSSSRIPAPTASAKRDENQVFDIVEIGGKQ